MSSWPWTSATWPGRLARIAAGLALAAGAGPAAPDSTPAPRVLVVHSYSRGFTWTDQEMDGILQVFRERWPSFDPSVVHLDAKHFRGPGPEQALLALLEARRPPEPYDAVIATDDAALDFLVRHRAEISGDAPIAFCGVNDPQRPAGVPRLAGVLEDVDLTGTLAMMRRLQPDLRRVTVVLDETETSRALALRVRAERAFAEEGLSLRLAQGLSMAEVEETARGLGPGDAVVLASFVTDRLGAVHSYEEIARRVSAASGAPVYGLWEFQLGQGIVGGSLTSGVRQGRRAAELAVALIEGRKAGVERAAGFLRAVDWRAARRFRLDPGRAGEDVTLVNAPRAPWNAYRRELLVAISAFGVLLVAAVGLLMVNRRLVLARRALRREEEERLRLRQRLEETQRLEAIGRFAGGLAHDLNNLLTPILVCARLVREQIPPGVAGDDLDTIAHAAERARELTRQVLAFSRRQHLDLRVLDLNEEVRAFDALLPRLIGEDVKVRLALAPGPAPVRGDRGQLQQVLMNLSVNARDAMPNGGVLELGTTAGPDGTFVLSVRDSGVGMTPEVRSRLFEPFFTTKPVGKGTGLGLSTSHGIVKQHGGEIEVESAPGAGTTFRIVLPRAGPEPEPEATAADVEPRAGTGMILLVEDEPLVRQLAKRVLSSAGYAVVEAEDGAGALAAARRLHAIDLLITDVVMPGIGGRELRDRIHADRPGLPVLFMSGYPALPGSGEDIAWAASDRVLAKPFTSEELLAQVEAVIGGPEPRGGLVPA
jgi:signal transduction histidine kinase/ActR/RegA family two-component response regulator